MIRGVFIFVAVTLVAATSFGATISQDFDLSVSLRLSGNGTDRVTGAVQDPDGNIYVVGQTTSSDFPIKHALDSTYNGAIDGFVCKYDPSADTLIFSTFLGGSSNDFLRSVALDSSGNVVVAGCTQSSNYPSIAAFQPFLNGFNDAFLSRLSPDGSSILASTYLGGGSYDEGFDVAVGSAGQIWLAGATQGGIPIVNASDNSHNGLADIFLAEFSSDLSAIEFSTYWGGSRADENPIIRLGDGRIVVAGDTKSSNFPVIGDSSDSFHGGSYDGFVFELSESPISLLFSTCVGGANEDRIRGLARDGAGGIWITGHTNSTDLALVSAIDSVLDGGGSGADAFVTTIETSGSTVFSTYIGGVSDDFGATITTASTDDVMIGVHTYGDIGQLGTQVSSFDSTANGGSDICLVAIENQSKTVKSVSYLGGSSSDGGWEDISSASTPSGIVLIGSFSSSVDFPIVNSQFSTVSSEYDATFSIIRRIPEVISVTVDGEEGSHVTLSAPRFLWGPAMPPVLAQLGFEVKVGTDNDWQYSEMWNPAPFNSSDTFVTYAGAPLVDGQTYYLRLRISDGVSWSNWYYTSFHMNTPPTVPVPYRPQWPDITVSTTPDLSLVNSTDVENDTLVYDFEVFYDSMLTQLAVASPPVAETQNPDSTSWTVTPPLDDNKYYYWRARAFDGYEYSAWSSMRSFIANNANEPPNPFVLVDPPDSTGPILYNRRPTFHWTYTGDPDPYEQVRYKFQLATDAGFLFKYQIDSVWTSYWMPPDSFGYHSHYWWRVYAVDKAGAETVSSNVKEFWVWTLGDVDHSNNVDISDLTRLIDYLYISFSPIEPRKVGDLDGDCTVDISDLSRLIDYLYLSLTPLEIGGCGS